MSIESCETIAIQNYVLDLKDESEAIPLQKVKTPVPAPVMWQSILRMMQCTCMLDIAFYDNSTNSRNLIG